MTSTEIMPARDLKAVLKPPSKLAAEKAAFRLPLPKLLEQYRNKFVAIHDERVVGSGDGLVTVALAAYAMFGYQPNYVDLVTDEPVRPVRMPHFKPLSSQSPA